MLTELETLRVSKLFLELDKKSYLESYSRDKPILADNHIRSDVREHESSSSIGVLRVTDFQAIMTKKCSLLVSQATGDR